MSDKLWIGRIRPVRHTLALLFASAALLLAADPWAKVQDLKSNTEVRIFKTGSAKPVIGKVEEVHADRIILATKNEELSIAKDQIDRLDYRPPQNGTRGTKTNTTKVQDPATSQTVPTPGTPSQTGPTVSSGTSYSFGSRPDFETIYRRAR